MIFPKSFDVIVIGGGHAGVEAAMASARSGVSTLLITHNIETIGQMSCNPAIGGIGKSHLVKEIDALGGIMAQATDRSAIHIRVLNSRKGPAVQATRAQTDRQLYRSAIRSAVEQQSHLSIFQQAVSDLIINNGRINGVVTEMGLSFHAPSVILTTGTFLSGLMHIGQTNAHGGRAGDPATLQLAEKLREAMPEVGRLKTGTPPRLDSTSLDYSQFDEQAGDYPRPIFSELATRDWHPPQRLCYITRTNEDTHAIIRKSLDQSPMFNGTITSTGPRYCPSIEDKVMRFSDKSSHQIFIEPEGLHTNEVYPNGISTSLPFDVQLAMVRSIKGFENAHITRPGYAIEYDYFEPRNLYPWLETKTIDGLFFAGQINGTTGYEEAAAQGLLAGINASLKARGEDVWFPKRDEAYLGVMVDDLITRGTTEPYRMFTSRAEYRLLLRQDNADQRLTPIGRKMKLISDKQWDAFNHKMEQLKYETDRLDNITITPAHAELHGVQIKNTCSASTLLQQPKIHYTDIITIANLDTPCKDERIVEQIEVQATYAGYLPRQAQEAQRLKEIDDIHIPKYIDYAQIGGLSAELQSKLCQFQPTTLGQASRIQGITPCALSLLQLHIKAKRKAQSA